MKVWGRKGEGGGGLRMGHGGVRVGGILTTTLYRVHSEMISMTERF